MKDLEVNINNASVAVNQERISGNFKITDGLTNAHVAGNLKGELSLQNWKEQFHCLIWNNYRVKL